MRSKAWCAPHISRQQRVQPARMGPAASVQPVRCRTCRRRFVALAALWRSWRFLALRKASAVASSWKLHSCMTRCTSARCMSGHQQAIAMGVTARGVIKGCLKHGKPHLGLLSFWLCAAAHDPMGRQSRLVSGCCVAASWDAGHWNAASPVQQTGCVMHGLLWCRRILQVLIFPVYLPNTISCAAGVLQSP